MNDQSRIDRLSFILARDDRWNDLIEWNFEALEVSLQIQPQRQVGTSKLPGHRDATTAQLVRRHWFLSNYHRAVAVAHARAAGAKYIFIMQIGVRMNAHGRKLQLCRERPAVEGLDVDQLVRE